ncbi:MAG: GIY-YIG nuclease family protein [Acidobacteria bacterium]|nr:GIY-YIG nuclease family protein [Acidobacteriota bacterium]
MGSNPTSSAKELDLMTNPSKSELKRAYKDNPPAAGIYRITNTANGRVLLGKGMNVRGILNSQQAQLQFGSHRNPQLQQDYNRFGAEQFQFEIIDQLEQSDKTPQQMQEDLTALEELWLEKLQPYGERGYNK